jgi:hypothetical protein
MIAVARRDWIKRARVVPLETVLNGIKLRRVGAELIGPCPKCGGTDRFGVNTRDFTFNCRRCGGKGRGPIDLQMFLDGGNLDEAVEKLTGEPPPKSNRNDLAKPHRDAGAWIYYDPAGKPYLKVRRFDKPDGSKFYPQYRWGDGQWLKGKPNAPKIPYRLPELLDSDHSEPIYVTEGEKCADAVAGLGLVATTGSEGAGKWTADLNEWFRDRIVYLLPDNDLPGSRHAEDVAKNLTGIAKAVCIINLTDLDVKEDVFDWIKRGGTKEKLEEFGYAAQEWQPKSNGEAGEGTGKEDDEQPAKAPDPVPAPRIVITLAEFLAKFEAPDYLVESLLQRGFLYALTGATGAGKTAVAPLLAVTVALRRPGQKFGPYAVEHGRVVYIAAENSTDVQMRFPPLLARFNVQPDALDLLVIDTIKNIDKDLPAIERDIREFGSVDLIIVDTSPRLFLGDNFNDDKQMLDHAVRLRKLTELPGKPCVVALGHPVKYPKSPEELLPKGGGAYLNELDGNLTLWKHDGHLTDLHWTGKFRGPEFESITFKLDVAYSTANVDKKGNALPTVTATHLTNDESAAIEANTANEEVTLLGAIRDNPRGTFMDWARACGWFVKGDRDNPNKMKVTRLIKSAEKAKLLQKSGRTYTLTRAGGGILKKNQPQQEETE